MKSVSHSVAFSVFALLLLSHVQIFSQTEDRCRDILQNGVRDEYSDLRNSDIRSAFKSSLCTDSAHKSGSNTGVDTGATIPLKVFTIEGHGGYTQNQIDELSNKYCGDDSAQLSDADFSSMMKRVASEKVVEAWSKCMSAISNNEGGLESTLDVDDDNIVFRVKWIPRFNVTSVNIDDFYVTGATCNAKTLQEGQKIGTEWEVENCVRNGNESVLITVQAADQMGSTVQKIPRRLPPPPPILYAQWTGTAQVTYDAPLIDCGCLSVEKKDRNTFPVINGFYTAPEGTKVRVSNGCSGDASILIVKDDYPVSSPPPPLSVSVPGRAFALIDLPRGRTVEADISGSIGAALKYLSCSNP